MLAILAAVKKWSSYLLGKQFLIKTDHHSLNFLLDQQTTTPAQQKWVVKMMGFDLKFIYREGSTNIVADACLETPLPNFYPFLPLIQTCLKELKLLGFMILTWYIS